MDKRSVIGNLSFGVGFMLGGLYQAYLVRWIGDWKPFHHALFAQFAIIIAALPM